MRRAFSVAFAAIVFADCAPKKAPRHACTQPSCRRMRRSGATPQRAR